MEKNISDILLRHFIKQTTAEEESIVAAYRVSHPEEYARLKLFFERGEINIKDFNAETAWKKVWAKHENIHTVTRTRTIRMFSTFGRMAAAAMLIMGVVIGTYFYLTNKQVVNQETLFADGTMQEKIVLSDSTIVWLNDDARLSYPAAFTGDHRQVELSGEAFFEVTKDPDKPFIVLTGNAEVKVLGTSFNVNTRDESTEVAVSTGRVQVTSKASGNHVVLREGYSAKASEKDVVAYETSDPNYNAWRTGIFAFRETPLQSVLADLNSFYGNRIQLSPEYHHDCDLTASFNNAPLEDVLEVLTITCGVSITKTAEGNYILQ